MWLTALLRQSKLHGNAAASHLLLRWEHALADIRPVVVMVARGSRDDCRASSILLLSLQTPS